MKGSAKIAKGRIEEAAGVLTNNDRLRVKGQNDQAMGRIKQTAATGVSKAKDKVANVVKKAENVVERTIDKAKSKRIGRFD